MKADIPKFYFTADLHLGHRNILKYNPNRECKTIEEMEEMIIKNWNEVVRPQDYVIVVGDVSFGGARECLRGVIEQLHGHKILVMGNHDRSVTKMLSIGFDWVCQDMTINVQGELVKISHLPYKHELAKSPHGQKFLHLCLEDNGHFLLHGHTHSTKKINGRMINVGVDAWKMKPVSMDQIASIIAKIKKQEQENNKIKLPSVSGLCEAKILFNEPPKPPTKELIELLSEIGEEE